MWNTDMCKPFIHTRMYLYLSLAKLITHPVCPAISTLPPSKRQLLVAQRVLPNRVVQLSISLGLLTIHILKYERHSE